MTSYDTAQERSGEEARKLLLRSWVNPLYRGLAARQKIAEQVTVADPRLLS
jgi:hypothetical protein